MLNVRPRPLVVNATSAIQKNNTPVDPKPRTHTKQATTPSSKCSQLSHTHTLELATLKCSLLDSVSHFLFPTSLFLSVLLHVFAISSAISLNTLLNAFPLSSTSTPLLSSSLIFISSAFPSQQKKTISVLNSSCLFFFFLLSSLYLQWLSPRVFSRFLFLSAVLLSPSVSFCLPLASPSVFFRTSHTRSRWLQRFAPLPVLPAPWRPTSTRTSTSLRASCQARSLLAGSTPLAVWGALPKRRGNAGSDSELPHHLNTFLEVR